MTRKATGPSPEEWLALYDAARRLRAAEPWQQMSDADVFGVRDPETGVTGYCCVMGQLGEYHAMHVYLGGQGIASYHAIRDASGTWADEPCPLNLFLVGQSQVSLAVEFRDAAEVPREEKARIKALGLSFRGRHAWPVFERNDPGLEPCPLEAVEARFLTVAIEQALRMVDRFRLDETVVTGPLANDRVLVRVPVARNTETVWTDAVEAFETASAIVPESLPDEVLRAVEALPVRNGFIEVGHTFLPALVKARKAERGMHPRMLLAVEPDKGVVLGFHLFQEGEFPGAVLEQVAAMLVTFGVRPRHLVLSDPWLHRVIGEGIPVLKPSLMLSRRIEAAEAAYQSLSGFMGG